MGRGDVHRSCYLFLGGLRPPKPSPLAGWFLGGGRGAAAPRPYAQTLPLAGYSHLSMPTTTQRIIWAYGVVLVGALLLALRRLALPNYFELEGLPLAIAIPSALYSCYTNPALSTCGDGVIFALTALGVVAATGWGSLGRSIFAVILVILPLSFFFLFAAASLAVPMLLIIPLAIEFGDRWLFTAR